MGQPAPPSKGFQIIVNGNTIEPQRPFHGGNADRHQPHLHRHAQQHNIRGRGIAQQPF